MNLLRTCALAALALASALVLAVFSVPASAAEQQRTVESFEAVHSYGSFKLVLRQATPAAVRLHGDPALLERVETRVVTRRGLATLEIFLRRGERFEGRGEIGIDIDVPSLRTLGMSGAGAALATGLDVKDLRVELAGSGTARLDTCSIAIVSGTCCRVPSRRSRWQRFTAMSAHSPGSRSPRRPSWHTPDTRATLNARPILSHSRC